MSVSKHEWLQSPSPQGSKIAEERWGAVNELNSHTVRQRCIQYSMCQYMAGPEFLTQANTRKTRGAHQASRPEGNIPKESEWIEEESRSSGDAEPKDQMELGRMTKGIMDSGGNGAGSQKEQCRNNSNRYAEEGCRACRKGFAHSGIDGLRAYIDVHQEKTGTCRPGFIAPVAPARECGAPGSLEDEEKNAQDIKEEDRDVIAKGRESTIDSDPGHHVVRDVEGGLQETQREPGSLQDRVDRNEQGSRRAGGLGVNHELRSAGATARKWHRGRREDKDVKDDRLDFLCDATDPVYKVHHISMMNTC
ncbi:hypothetical protein GGX14DRAFT_389690 [Mycena pura]|uniref:Uncharacterized protein n=1 Tax=Mycena pura TaxID=153505 RepID=A0AAD6VR69_9AGAR|nr:hypothetical protein GGX14DRAFT_389690 [Mycena pura]